MQEACQNRILLIGAGYIGTHLLETWAVPHFIAMTTTPEKIKQLESLPRVERAILPAQIEDAVVECDGLIICVAPKNGASYEETYLETAKTVCSLLRKQTTARYFVYISSTSVYGQQERPFIDESTQPQPASVEGKILLEAEERLLACGNGCILRPGGIYGPGRELEARARRLSGKKLPGRGDAPTNHSHVDDITRAIVFCFEHQLTGVYNIVSDAHPTRQELYDTLCRRQGLPPPIWNPDIPSMHGTNSPISSEKIKKAGFNFRVENSLFIS